MCGAEVKRQVVSPCVIRQFYGGYFAVAGVEMCCKKDVVFTEVMVKLPMMWKLST